MPLPDWLSTSPHAQLLEAMHALAWADGALDDDERRVVAGLVRRLGVDVGRPDLEVWLETPTRGESVPLREHDRFDLALILFHSIALGYADGDYSGNERARVEAWAQDWGFSRGELAEIEAEVKRDLAASADPFQVR